VDEEEQRGADEWWRECTETHNGTKAVRGLRTGTEMRDGEGEGKNRRTEKGGGDHYEEREPAKG